RFNALIDWVAKFAGELTIKLTRIPLRASGDLGSQQSWNDSIFVCCPNGPILPEERGARALFTSKTKRAVQQPVDEPLESHANLVKFPRELAGDAVDDAAADQGLSDRKAVRPFIPVGEQVLDTNRKIVVGRKQAHTLRHDAMAIVVSVTGERHVEFVFQPDQ